ncbi:MAG: CerR family C-terminal domain-containing protein [Deltaproteobacteria bacterium]|nr:CerR family C-terminal domain-containing protein [Deltaproteobacteria bacterium]
MGHEGKADVTKDRILNEAEILFAHKGFHGVTVREITETAKCNLAAVNYHFGNKWNLYLAVFRFRWLPRAKRLRETVINVLDEHENPTRTDVVKALAQAFLEGPITDEERKQHALLIFRELAEPTEAFELVANEALRPLFRTLTERMRLLVPEDMDEKRLRLNIFSIFAMVIHFNFARAAVTHITGQEYDRDFKSLLVEHITNFSLNGLGTG